jgi:hypothetical protein
MGNACVCIPLSDFEKIYRQDCLSGAININDRHSYSFNGEIIFNDGKIKTSYRVNENNNYNYDNEIIIEEENLSGKYSNEWSGEVGYSPALIFAAENDDLELATDLLVNQHADPNIDGGKAIVEAFNKKNKVMCKLLLENGARFEAVDLKELDSELKNNKTISSILEGRDEPKIKEMLCQILSLCLLVKNKDLSETLISQFRVSIDDALNYARGLELPISPQVNELANELRAGMNRNNGQAAKPALDYGRDM